MNPLLTVVKGTVNNILAPILRHAWTQIAPDIRTLKLYVPSDTYEEELEVMSNTIEQLLRGGTPFHDIVVYWSLVTKAEAENDRVKVLHLRSLIQRVDTGLASDVVIPSLYRLLTAYAACIVISDRDIHNKTKDEEIPRIIKSNFSPELSILRTLEPTAVPPSDMILEWCRGFKIEEIPTLWKERLHMNVAGSRLLKVCGVILNAHQQQILQLERGPEMVAFMLEAKKLGSWVTLAFHARLKGEGTIPIDLIRCVKSLIAHLRLEMGEAFWNALIVSKALHPDCLKNVTPTPVVWNWKSAEEIINDNRWMSIAELPRDDPLHKKQSEFRFWLEEIEVLFDQELPVEESELKGISRRINALQRFDDEDKGKSRFMDLRENTQNHGNFTRHADNRGDEELLIRESLVETHFREASPQEVRARPTINSNARNKTRERRSQTVEYDSPMRNKPSKDNKLSDPAFNQAKSNGHPVDDKGQLEIISNTSENILPTGLNDADFGNLEIKQ